MHFGSQPSHCGGSYIGDKRTHGATPYRARPVTGWNEVDKPKTTGFRLVAYGLIVEFFLFVITFRVISIAISNIPFSFYEKAPNNYPLKPVKTISPVVSSFTKFDK